MRARVVIQIALEAFLFDTRARVDKAAVGLASVAMLWIPNYKGEETQG
jgi:hypothetical protein